MRGAGEEENASRGQAINRRATALAFCAPCPDGPLFRALPTAVNVAMRRPLASAAGVAGRRAYGGLADEDRIFTNLYGEQDFTLKAAMKRVRRPPRRRRMRCAALLPPACVRGGALPARSAGPAAALPLAPLHVPPCAAPARAAVRCRD